jgi:hypothetical protein
VTSALISTALPLSGHRLLGLSTGFMTDDRGDWWSLVDRAAAFSTAAIELSALSECELPSLEAFLDETPSLPFFYVSLHAPSKGRHMPERDLVAKLEKLSRHASAIVMHPDSIQNPEHYLALGSAVVLENMDSRKVDGRTSQDMKRWFAALPDAGLCLDLAHVSSIDPELTVGQELLDEHGHRLRHVHLSSLDDDCHHRRLTSGDERRFRPLLDRCRDVPWILEAPAR